MTILSHVTIRAGVLKFRGQSHGLFLPPRGCLEFATILRGCTRDRLFLLGESLYASVVREFAGIAGDPALCDVLGKGRLPMTRVDDACGEEFGEEDPPGIGDEHNPWTTREQQARYDFGFSVVRSTSEPQSGVGLYLPSKACAKLAAVLDAFADGFCAAASSRYDMLAADARVLASVMQVPLGGIVAGGTLELSEFPHCGTYFANVQQPFADGVIYREVSLSGPSKREPASGAPGGCAEQHDDARAGKRERGDGPVAGAKYPMRGKDAIYSAHRLAPELISPEARKASKSNPAKSGKGGATGGANRPSGAVAARSKR